MVLIFPNFCLWRRSLRSNLGGIDPEKLYRATLRSKKSTVNKSTITFQVKTQVEPRAAGECVDCTVCTMVCTLIDHSSRPISAREVAQLL